GVRHRDGRRRRRGWHAGRLVGRPDLHVGSIHDREHPVADVAIFGPADLRAQDHRPFGVVGDLEESHREPDREDVAARRRAVVDLAQQIHLPVGVVADRVRGAAGAGPKLRPDTEYAVVRTGRVIAQAAEEIPVLAEGRIAYQAQWV